MRLPVSLLTREVKETLTATQIDSIPPRAARRIGLGLESTSKRVAVYVPYCPTNNKHIGMRCEHMAYLRTTTFVQMGSELGKGVARAGVRPVALNCIWAEQQHRHCEADLIDERSWHCGCNAYRRRCYLDSSACLEL